MLTQLATSPLDSTIGEILPFDFYQQNDVVLMAQKLLGKVLVSDIQGDRTSGIIVETEAYRGEDDRASHAYLLKRTPRTETMFLAGGHAYIYLCYGMHHLFNVVVGQENKPNAILIRGLEPLEGVEIMLKRRKMDKLKPKISACPACLSQALGLHRNFNGQVLWEKNGIWLEDRGLEIAPPQILATTRIGVNYAGEDAKRPWRFLVKDNPFVSAYPRL